MLTRTRIMLLALFAVAAVIVPTAGANPNAPVRSSFELPDLEIFDLHLTTACGGTRVFANVSGTVDRTLYFDNDGNVDHAIEALHGRITWFTRGTGTSYSSSIVNRSRIDFPEGVDFFAPATITVTGHHGGTFPIGGGPPGGGTLKYNAFIYTIGDDGFPYTAVEGDPISMSGNFEGTTRRICEALA
jgi:hypothetical protein